MGRQGTPFEVSDDEGERAILVGIRKGRQPQYEADESLREMDTIVTKEGGRVVLRFDDGALSSLDEKSRLRVEKTNWFSYLGGKIYFTFKKH